MRLAAGSTRRDEKTHVNHERKRKLAPRAESPRLYERNSVAYFAVFLIYTKGENANAIQREIINIHSSLLKREVHSSVQSSVRDPPREDRALMCVITDLYNIKRDQKKE